MRFVDTNVLLYSVSNHPAEADKAKQANALLRERDLGLSVQVLQEFYVQATRASRSDRLTHEQAIGLLDAFRRFPIHEPSAGLVFASASTARGFRISYWDAAIIEAARAMGCGTVLSEDMSHGQNYGGVRVENPFAS